MKTLREKEKLIFELSREEDIKSELVPELKRSFFYVNQQYKETPTNIKIFCYPEEFREVFSSEIKEELGIND